MDHEQGNGKWRRAALIAGVVLLVVGMGAALYRFLTGTAEVPRKHVPEVVQLKLIQPPPPPPPPPPPKMVEQPKVREEVRAEQPMEKVDPRPAAPTPPGPPALDAKAEGPGDAFALGGKPGGGDFLGGGGGGGGGSKYGWYAAMIQGHVQRSVQSQPNLQRTRYRVSVEIWLSADGTPQRVELISSTGAAELDQKLREALLRMSRMPQPPPSDLPQPVVLQVSSS